MISVEFLEKSFIEEHEHEDGENILICKVADADGGKEVVPVKEALILEIKDLKESSFLVLNGLNNYLFVAIELRKHFDKGIVGDDGSFGLWGLGLGIRLEYLFDLVNFRGLPKVFQLARVDRLEVMA